ncbi:MAG: flippase [Methanosarcinales archaeon]|nr:MAG: flippase [Methanosarcinales archaeon]
MSTVRRIAKNTLVLTLADIITRVLSLMLVVYIARYLGDVGFGRYSFAFAFCSLFLIMGDLGLGTLAVRDVARDKSKASKYLGNLIPIKLILSILMFGLIFIMINIMSYPPITTLAVYVIGLSLTLGAFSNSFKFLFNAFEKMEYNAFVRIIEKVVVVSLGISVLLAGYGLIEVVSAFLVGSVFSVFCCILIIYKKFPRPKFEIDIDFWKSLLKQSIPFWIYGIFAPIYFYIDVVMLSMMKGDAVTGWYNASYSLIAALVFIPAAFMTSVFPVVSVFFKTSKTALYTAYEKSFKYLFILVLPITIGTTLLADKIIWGIYTIEFSNSILALQILIWAFLILSFNAVFKTVLGAIEKQIVMAKVATIGAGVNIALNIILIPYLSLIGASIATVVTEGIMFLFYFNSVSIPVGTLPLYRICKKPIVAALLMGGCVYMLRDFNVILVVILAAMVYFSIIYLVGSLSKEDINMFKGIFKVKP